MTQIERIFRIHRFLQQGRPVSLKKITEALEVSSATFNRDLQKMRDYFGAPILYDKKSNGYIYDPDQERFELPGFWLNQRELYALLLIHNLLGDLDFGILSPILDPLGQRIKDVLSLCGQSAQSLNKTIQIHPLYQRPVCTQIFAGVAQALMNQKPLKITYHSRSRDEITQRIIDPQRLMFYRSNWYLLAWCREGEGLKTFALDRIQQSSELDQEVFAIDDKQLDDYCLEGFGLWRGFDVETAVLEFFGPGLQYVADEIWHPQQKGKWEDDRYVLSLPFSNPDELILEILRYGAQVRVIEPVWLRDLVIQRHTEALAVYGVGVS